MNTISLNNGSSKSTAQQTLDQRIGAIETTLSALKDHLLASRVSQSLPPTAQRRVHLDHARDMLARRGELNVADLRKVLGVSIKTATRLLKALSQSREGHLFFEPVGHTERLVLVHPSRVALERASRVNEN